MVGAEMLDMLGFAEILSIEKMFIQYSGFDSWEVGL